MLKKPSKYRHKAQSAMEYLMTYGWAILIIAVVLGALFSLGVFNGTAILGNACIAASGYLCQNPLYLHGSGGILTTLGQNTGTTWTSANFIFVPQGAAISGGLPVTLTQPVIAASGNYPGFAGGASLATSNTLTSGQTATLWLPVNGISTNTALCGVGANPACPNVGTTATGTIWVQYQTSSGGPYQYAQIATINIKAS